MQKKLCSGRDKEVFDVRAVGVTQKPTEPSLQKMAPVV